jgi:putative tricarboxylic transport membrane protein
VIEAAGVAFEHVASLQYLGWVLVGTCVGLLVGVIPGLGGVTGMSLLLPFIFGMDAYSGLALLMGMAAVVHTSDTFPSVLIGLPGSAGSQATIMDGYPLARQGQAERALGAAFSVSMVGGFIGAAVLLGTIVVIRPVVLALGSPELFMFTLLGLTMVGLLTAGQPLPGLIVGALGLLTGAIGAAPATAEYRYTFDVLYLYDGFPIVVVALGLFAVPEMIDLLLENRPIAAQVELLGKRLDGVRDALRNKFLIVRSAVFGNIIGVVPGLGGAVADWLAYGFARQTVKDASTFGKGDIRGVIAPESANNAKEAGTLVPTLLFGIPGSPTAAILLGGLLLLGIQAGPQMVGRELPLTISIVWTLVIANAFGALACFLLTKQIARVTTVPPKVLAPCLLVVISLAAYQSSFHWGDIVLLIGIGLVGWWWKQVGWARAPFIIGFVLSAPAERYLHLSMSRYGFEWMLRPVVLAITLIIITGVVLEVVRQGRRRRRQRTENEAGMQ